MAEAPAGLSEWWSREKEKSEALVDTARRFRPIITDPILYYSAMQVAVNKFWSSYPGIYESVVQLLDRLLATCGVCRTMLFVGSGLGHVEYALHSLIRCVAAANPAKYPYVDIKAVITDGVRGRFAPPDAALPAHVIRMSAEDAIKHFGNIETVVVQIKPDCVEATGIAEAAARAGCPGILWWGEVPTSGFIDAELNEAAAQMGHLTPAEQERAKLMCIAGDGGPKSDGNPDDWRALNRLYTRFCIGSEHQANQDARGKVMAWVCFVLRERPSEVFGKPIQEAPLPILSGPRLRGVLERNGRMMMAARR